jgi:uncharacterized protein involved in exopolysaccharide biosynthesis
MTQVPTVGTSSQEDLQAYFGDSPPLGPREPGPGQGWGDASASGVLHAIRARWVWVLLSVLVFAGAAAYVGVERKPTYTATASVNVGQVDVRVQALQGFVAGASSLAASYSRIATSQRIVDPVAKRLGTSRANLAGRLSATVVPDSPIFEIIGTGATAGDAVRLTNAVTREMQAYVARRSSGDNAADKLLEAYSIQAGKTATLQRRYIRLRNLRERATSGLPQVGVGEEQPDVPTAGQVTNALVAHQTADLQRQALGAQYQSRSSETASTAGVELLKRAFTAESDRQKVLQQLVAIGLVAGLLVGASLALLLGRRATRRNRLKAQRA